MIASVQNNTVTEIRDIYRVEHKYAEEHKGQVMVHHIGDFSTDLINGLAEAVEDLMVSNGDSKKLIKRVFSILIEGLQNIRRHGDRAEDNNLNAFFLLVRYKDRYEIVMGNMIGRDDRPVAQEYLDRINLMELTALKELYLDILNNSFFTRKGGVGLGFLTMRLKSEQPLLFNFSEMPNQKCFFTVKVSINRNL